MSRTVAEIQRDIRQRRKLARERLRAMPLWYRSMIKALKLDPETVTYTLNAPTKLHMNNAGIAAEIEHTGEITVMIRGVRRR